MGALRRLTLAALALLAAGAWLAPGATRAAELDAKAALARAEGAIGNTVGPYVLTDHRGRPLPLRQLRGKPLVVSLVYTSCASVCPATTQTLIERVRSARATLGADAFNVLTFGFDARNDTPKALAAFASTQRIDLDGWYLATADAATTKRLLDDLGFSYESVAGAFQHVTQTTILDAEGRVYRQIYGDDFPLPVFMEPLKELVLGTVASIDSVGAVIDRIRFICTVYDPATGAYAFDYSQFFGIVVGGFSLIVFAIVILRLWRQSRRLPAPRARTGEG